MCGCVCVCFLKQKREEEIRSRRVGAESGIRERNLQWYIMIGQKVRIVIRVKYVVVCVCV